MMRPMCESAIIGFRELMNATTETDGTEFDKWETAWSNRSFLCGTVVG
jgi:hypothetical protein